MPHHAEILEELEALRRTAGEVLNRARDSNRVTEALASTGHERTADALAWRRRSCLRELCFWIREINDAATVLLACQEVGHDVVKQVLQEQGSGGASLGIASKG